MRLAPRQKVSTHWETCQRLTYRPNTSIAPEMVSRGGCVIVHGPLTSAGAESDVEVVLHPTRAAQSLLQQANELERNDYTDAAAVNAQKADAGCGWFEDDFQFGGDVAQDTSRQEVRVLTSCVLLSESPHAHVTHGVPADENMLRLVNVTEQAADVRFHLLPSQSLGGVAQALHMAPHSPLAGLLRLIHQIAHFGCDAA